MFGRNGGTSCLVVRRRARPRSLTPSISAPIVNLARVSVGADLDAITLDGTPVTPGPTHPCTLKVPDPISPLLWATSMFATDPLSSLTPARLRRRMEAAGAVTPSCRRHPSSTRARPCCLRRRTFSTKSTCILMIFPSSKTWNVSDSPDVAMSSSHFGPSRNATWQLSHKVRSSITNPSMSGSREASEQ